MIQHPNSSLQSVNKVDDQTDSPPWSELPSLAVEKVYSFLNGSDRIRMSSVCRNWHQVFISPSLWKEVTLRLPDFDHITERCPNVIFALRFGAMFRDVKIVFQEIPADFPLPVDPITEEQLKLFLQALTSQSQLLSISFKKLGYYLLPNDADDYDIHFTYNVYQMILNFIKSQKILQSFKIDVVGHENEEEILSTIFVNNYKTLRYLHIPIFDCPSCTPLESTNLTVDDDLNFLLLMNLEILEMDYTKMFEIMMLSFYEYRNRVDMRRRKGRLKQMRLKCTDVDGVNIIQPHVWEYFWQIFPGLKFDLYIDYAYGDPISLHKFIDPDMPVRTLKSKIFYNPHINNEVGLLLRHITSCGINKSLEVLKICWGNNSPNLASDFISFTSVCPKLKTLELFILHPVVGLDNLFNSWRENRPMSLHVVKFLIKLPQQFTKEEEMIYTSLSDFYAPLLQLLEIYLSMELCHDFQSWLLF